VFFSVRIDATQSTGMCRLVNDEWRKPNSRMKVVEVQGVPRLFLFAITTIDNDMEIVYNFARHMDLVHMPGEKK